MIIYLYFKIIMKIGYQLDDIAIIVTSRKVSFDVYYYNMKYG